MIPGYWSRRKGKPTLSMLVCILISLVITSVGSSMTGFIVGGKQAFIKDWPFIAYLLAHEGKQPIAACGSSLISSQTLLTAAHCLDDVTNKKEHFGEITFGVHMGHGFHKKAIMHRDVLDYRTHEDYDIDDVYFDIGIVFLSRPVDFSRTVKKVLLMNWDIGTTMAEEGGLAVAGWGKYSPDSGASEVLKSLDQTIIDQDLCYRYINETDRAPGIICAGMAGKFNETEYAYSGDSGGPLARVRDQYLAGLVSWRMESHGLTVYTSVPYYYSWIQVNQASLFQEYCSNRDAQDY